MSSRNIPYIPRIRLHRVGSDPEFLFGERADLDYIIIPANTIMGKNKVQATNSFIGTDNRPVLGEIRPSPSRNLKAQLFEIGYALDAIAQHLQQKRPHVEILALPELHNETLGGHIHASFWTDDPVHVGLYKHGFFFSPDGSVQPRIPGSKPIPTPVYERLQIRMRDDQMLAPWHWGSVMSYLIKPFEFWIQPWVRRAKRNLHYGADQTADLVRIGHGIAPSYPNTAEMPSWMANSAYVHWEYRLPSTWLQAPTLAYAYLALAKYTLLNFRIVAETMAYDSSDSPNAKPIPTQQLHNYQQLSNAQNDEYGAIFAKRLKTIANRGAIVTKDLRDMQRALDTCYDRRSAWFREVTAIDLNAWRALL